MMVRRVSVTCPPCLVDYQVRGVDHGDQMMGYYNIGRWSVKWWKRGYSFILEVCFYTIQQHGKVASEKRDFLSFRIALAEELIGSFTSRVPTGRPRSTTTEQEVRLDSTKPHLPIVEGPKLECVVCCKVREVRGLSRREYRPESQVRCSLCEVHLCLTSTRNCFYKYHTAARIWE